MNPRWRSQGYPYENCWDIDEFFSEAARRGGRLLEEARRIYWEAYWRLAGRYKRGRRFFDVYKVVDDRVEPVRDERWVLSQIVLAGNIYIVPEEAKISTRRIYRELFGPITK